MSLEELVRWAAGAEWDPAGAAGPPPPAAPSSGPEARTPWDRLTAPAAPTGLPKKASGPGPSLGPSLGTGAGGTGPLSGSLSLPFTGTLAGAFSGPPPGGLTGQEASPSELGDDSARQVCIPETLFDPGLRGLSRGEARGEAQPEEESPDAISPTQRHKRRSSVTFQTPAAGPSPQPFCIKETQAEHMDVDPTAPSPAPGPAPAGPEQERSPSEIGPTPEADARGTHASPAAGSGRRLSMGPGPASGDGGEAPAGGEPPRTVRPPAAAKGEAGATAPGAAAMPGATGGRVRGLDLDIPAGGRRAVQRGLRELPANLDVPGRKPQSKRRITSVYRPQEANVQRPREPAPKNPKVAQIRKEVDLDNSIPMGTQFFADFDKVVAEAVGHPSTASDKTVPNAAAPAPAAAAGSLFQTAGGNRVHISEEALRKGRALMASPEADEEEAREPPRQPAPVDAGAGSLFQTAGGNRVHISEEALEKGREALRAEPASDPGGTVPTAVPDAGPWDATAPADRAVEAASPRARARPVAAADRAAAEPLPVLTGFGRKGGIVVSPGVVMSNSPRISLSGLHRCHSDTVQFRSQVSVSEEDTTAIVKAQYKVLCVDGQSYSAPRIARILREVCTLDVSLDWVQNHMELVLWKLVSYSHRFPAALGGAVNLEELVRQLYWRHVQEAEGKKCLIRQICSYAKCPSNSCTMVFFVSGIVGESRIELSDGHYRIAANLDDTLADRVAEGKIFLGLKLAVCGAMLHGLEEPCSALEQPAAAFLELRANHVRPAPWDARLGVRALRTMVVKIPSIVSGGGVVPSILVAIRTKYPVQYREWSDADGMVVRSERTEELERDRLKHEREKVEERVREDCGKLEENGQKIDQEAFNEMVTEECKRAGLLRDNPTTLLKVRVQSLAEDSPDYAIVQVWRPCELLVDNLRPGKIFQVTDLSQAGHGTAGPGPIVLNATLRTRWRPVGAEEAAEKYGFRFSEKPALTMKAMSAPTATLAEAPSKGAEIEFMGIVLHKAPFDGGMWVFLYDDTCEDIIGGQDCPWHVAMNVSEHCEGFGTLKAAKAKDMLVFSNATFDGLAENEQGICLRASVHSTCRKVSAKGAASQTLVDDVEAWMRDEGQGAHEKLAEKIKKVLGSSP